MEIKSYNQEPTEENVLQSIMDDTCGRNDSLRNFLEIIDKSVDLPVFAINAEWGAGKTFFVLQAKMILEYLNPNCKQDATVEDELRQLLEQPVASMEKPNMTRKIVPVYYNAWLYDDHKDPLKSFLYFLAVTFKEKYSKLGESGLRKWSEALNLITLWRCGNEYNLENFVKSFSGKDVAEDIVYLEDAKLLVDKAFSDLLEENDGLVVFVDEIDRCNPRYAVDFLEIIKHFFSCSKVQFVFSTNIKQLTETICNVYGTGFDSTRYLNKFFDFIIELPPVSVKKLLDENHTLQSSYYVHRFAKSLINSMHFTLREINDYLGPMAIVTAKCQKVIDDAWRYDDNIFAITCYPILLLALSLGDRKKYEAFVSGTGEEILVELLTRWEQWMQFVRKTLFSNNPTMKNDETEFIDAVRAHYTSVFGDKAGKDPEVAGIKESVLGLASLIG